MSQIQKFQEAIKGKSTVELFSLPEVASRFIANYRAVTGREDGENRLVNERFAYLQILADKPELQNVDNFYHVSALVFAGTTGLSFRDNKLYVQPNGKGGLKVSSSPAGKREMFEMMPTIKKAPEAVIVFKGDHFIHDKANGVVKEHWTTKETVEKMTLDNIRAAYQRLYYKDGSIVDTVVYQEDLVKAKNKSKMPNGPWTDFTGEMVKKTATNRAYRLYHKYPNNIVTFGPDVEGDEEEEQEAKVVDDTAMPNPPPHIDESTGEVLTPEEYVKEEPKKEQQPTTTRGSRPSLMD